MMEFSDLIWITFKLSLTLDSNSITESITTVSRARKHLICANQFNAWKNEERMFAPVVVFKFSSFSHETWMRFCDFWDVEFWLFIIVRKNRKRFPFTESYITKIILLTENKHVMLSIRYLNEGKTAPTANEFWFRWDLSIETVCSIAFAQCKSKVHIQQARPTIQNVFLYFCSLYFEFKLSNEIRVNCFVCVWVCCCCWILVNFSDLKHKLYVYILTVLKFAYVLHIPYTKTIKWYMKRLL